MSDARYVDVERRLMPITIAPQRRRIRERRSQHTRASAMMFTMRERVCEMKPFCFICWLPERRAGC